MGENLRLCISRSQGQQCWIETKLDHFVAATEAIPEKRPRGLKIFTCSADGGAVNFVALCTFQFPSFFHLAMEWD
jgi:hypothetical protein